MHGPMPLWANPAIVAIATIVAACLVALVVGLIGKAIRARRRPKFRMAAVNPFPPADTAIDQIRREIDESEKRSITARFREEEDRKRRHLENQWREDGEVELTKKKQ